MNAQPMTAPTPRRPFLTAAALALPLAAVVLLGACGGSPGSAGSAAGGPSAGTPAVSASSTPASPTQASPTQAASSAPAGQGQTVTVDLTFSGAVSGHLTGTGPGRCSYYDIVNNRGLDYEVDGADFGQPSVGHLQLSGVSASAQPAAILNTDTASYGWYPQDGGTIKLKGDRTGASIDATLTKIAGQDKVRVSGTISCG